jgi:hypothetical protein
LAAAPAGDGVSVAAFAVLGRGGTDGGTEARGRGGDGFFDWFASSAMGRS